MTDPSSLILKPGKGTLTLMFLGSSGRSYKKTRGRGRDPRSNAGKAPQQQEAEKHDSKQTEWSNGRGGYRQYRGGKKRFDRKRKKVKMLM